MISLQQTSVTDRSLGGFCRCHSGLLTRVALTGEKLTHCLHNQRKPKECLTYRHVQNSRNRTKKRPALVAEIIFNNCRYGSQMLQLDKQQVY